MRRKEKLKITGFEQVTIENFAGLGNCITHTEQGALFVQYAAPGDIADVRITDYKKKVHYGKIDVLHTPSTLRIDPTCEHFKVCGGCKWQHVAYTTQLGFKQNEVKEQLNRIGKVDDYEFNPIIGCESEWEYRNKVELTFSDFAYTIDAAEKAKNALGFHVPGRYDWVTNINQCHLIDNTASQIAKSIHTFALTNEYSFFNLRSQIGLLRTLLIRKNVNNLWMVLLTFTEDNTEKINAILQHLKDAFPQISSLLFAINRKRNDTMEGLQIQTFFGEAFIIETLGKLKFRIQAQSFFQTNTKQAEKLYQITNDFAGLTGKEIVYDLYTGTGSIALSVAHNAAKVIGIEYVDQAIADAHKNMELNKIKNCEFYAGDMVKVLTPQFIEKHGQPQVIITDPPRAGMHPQVVETILATNAQRIVYISCNPSTQARDIALLCEKYELIKVQPIDMFPHTHHIESVALLELKK